MLRLTTFLILCSAAFSALAQENQLVPMTPDMVPIPGAGFDFARLRFISRPCIDVSKTKTQMIDLSQQFGGRDEGEVKKVEESTDVASELELSYRSMLKALSSSSSVEGSISNSVHYRQDKSTWILTKFKSKQPTVIDPSTVEMMPDLPAPNSPEFRERCGDYYVAGYLAASKFYGILEIDKAVFETDTNARLKMEEKVDAMVTSGESSTEIKAALKTAQGKGLVHVVEKARGNGDAKLTATGDVESLLSDYQNFPADFKPEPVTAILVPYPQLNRGVLSRQQRIMEDNARLWFEYRRLADAAQAAIDKPGNFLPYKPGTPNRWDAADIETLHQAILDQQDKISDGISACGEHPETCPSLRAGIDPNSAPKDFKKLLPVFLGWPSSCAEVEHIYARTNTVQPAPDGDYTLYFQHNSRFKYSALCRNMASGPETYLKLKYATAPDGTGKSGHNFAQVAPDIGGEHHYVGTLSMTVYSAIRVKDTDTMEIDRSDDSQAKAKSGKTTRQDGIVMPPVYGGAGQCDGDENHAGMAHANIDLQGMVFKVNEADFNANQGYRAEKGIVTFLLGDQVVEIASPHAYCGGSGAITLKLKPRDM